MKEWSHLQDIKGSDTTHLQGRLIGLAVCGSVAALETHRVARGLMRHGADVQILLSRAACELVSSTSLSWCTGRPAFTELSARCEHLELFGESGEADLLLIAPMTANTLGKIACGLDDNLITTCATTALGNKIPILCAPGMHAPMMENPAVLRNLETVREWGVEVLSAHLSEGKQKMMSADEIVARTLRRLGGGELAGKRVLITGGPTREFLDPARCLTNPSSGLTACLLAEEAFRRGAEVELVYGPGSVRPAPWIPVRKVVSTADMLAGVQESVHERVPDIIVAAAAVCDFAPQDYQEVKRPTSQGGFELPLRPTAKIIDWLRQNCPASLMVAFKAASSRTKEELEQAAQPYLMASRADLVVANSVILSGQGFESETNRYVVCGEGWTEELGPESKRGLSSKLWSVVLKRTRP